MDYQTLVYEVEGPVGTLTLNRPKAVNAVNHQMMEELLDFWEARQRDFDTSGDHPDRGGREGASAPGLRHEGRHRWIREKGLTAEGIYRNQSRFSGIYKLMRLPAPAHHRRGARLRHGRRPLLRHGLGHPAGQPATRSSAPPSSTSGWAGRTCRPATCFGAW